MKYVKCCFLIDATSSMGPYIESAKRQARNIMNTLKQENACSSFLFGAVFYRDFGDTPQFYIVPFKEDITDDIRYVQPEGGDDIPEDVAGGYQEVLNMNWDLADVKFCFHIADAPPHGILWHSKDMHDNHPNSAHRPLEDLISQLHRKSIRLSFIRINSTTDRMLENFKNIYGDALNIMDLDTDANEMETLDREFSGMITRHVSSTLSLMD